jgi:hypothetical protein
MSKLLTAFIAIGASSLHGQVLAEALLALPASTQSLEYDNLGELRKLPNYAQLRGQYSGAPLRDVRSALSRIGISEDDLQEVVTAAGPGGFYGVVAGMFSRKATLKLAARAGVEGDEFLCPNIKVCVVFLGDSLAGFGSLAQVKDMVETRRGALARLSSNKAFVDLIHMADASAPILGVGATSELERWIDHRLSGLLPVIKRFGYSVKLAGTAHVNLTLECESELSAAGLHQVLNALNLAKNKLPFERMEVDSARAFIDLKLIVHANL